MHYTLKFFSAGQTICLIVHLLGIHFDVNTNAPLQYHIEKVSLAVYIKNTDSTLHKAILHFVAAFQVYFCIEKGERERGRDKIE
jgi:hypothetical protein